MSTHEHDDWADGDCTKCIDQRCDICKGTDAIIFASDGLLWCIPCYRRAFPERIKRTLNSIYARSKGVT